MSTSSVKRRARSKVFGISALVAVTIIAASVSAEADDSTGSPESGAFEPARESHPLVRKLAALIDSLAARGIELDAGARGSVLAECAARAADPFARVFDAAAYARLLEEQAGRDYHTGYRFTVKNGVPFVAATPDHVEPALHAGEEIVRIDGEPTANLTLCDVVARVRGHSATTLALTVRRGGAALTVEVARARATLPPIELAEVWPRDIGYARVNGLFRADTGAVAALLREWDEKNLAGAILDLRGASGDDVAGAAALAEPFASPGSLLFSVRDRMGNDLDRYRASDRARAIGMPLMVLTDEKTSGASELFAAVASDSLRGVLTVGRATAGNPCIRDGVELPDGDVLYIAVRQIVTGNGSVLDGRSGVPPNLLVAARAARIDYEPDDLPDRRQRLAVEAIDRELRDRVRGDAILQRALDVLLGLKALNIRAGGGS